MTHLIAIALCITGFASLCAAMPRHQRMVVGRLLGDAAGRRLRLAGGAALLLALAVDLAGLGAAYGAIAWCGHLTVAAALVVARLNRASSRPSSKHRAGDR